MTPTLHSLFGESLSFLPQALYIDPATGSMLFAVLLAVVSTSFYSLRLFLIKLRFRFHSGKQGVQESIPDLVIFSDDKRYWTVFEPICRELDQRGERVSYLTASEDDPAFHSGLVHLSVEFIGEGRRGFAKLNTLEAKVLLATTPGLDVYQWKRSKGIRYYVHIPHAASEVTLYRMFGLDYYDAVLLSGSFQADDIRALEARRALPPKELRLVGIPYMDVMRRRLTEAKPLTETRRTILLAPSWGENAIFAVYGGRIIDRLLETDWQIIVRPHPQSFVSERERMDDLLSRYPESDRLSWNRDTDNFDVLCRADLLISDFSGVIFEFALVYDKPVLYTEPDFDLAVYDAWWLDTPLWTTGALPRLGKALREEDLSDLDRLIDKLISDPRYASGRDEVRQECWVNPGSAAASCADFLQEKVRLLTSDLSEER